MTKYIKHASLSVATCLDDFVRSELLAGVDIKPSQFWQGLEKIIDELLPYNDLLIRKRRLLQAKIDHWHLSNDKINLIEYKQFLSDIGYILPVPERFTINNGNVDKEISSLFAPQLVAPVTNTHFAVNAANARWGSLYNALFLSDVIATQSYEGGHQREQAVVDYSNGFLDMALPLISASHADVVNYFMQGNELAVKLGDGSTTHLLYANQFVGYEGTDKLSSVILVHNGLHIDIQIDHNHEVGRRSPAGVKDIIIESALSIICDFEDSVVAVDAADKIICYRNWLRLMQGTLIDVNVKDGVTTTKNLRPDRIVTSPGGSELILKSRSLLMIRNVGQMMMTDAILDRNGNEVPEGFIDAMISVVAAIYDIKALSACRNSLCQSIYIIKPKLHGPEEAALIDRLFLMIEEILELPAYTVKIGLMDEERRTSVNLQACIYTLRNRIIFINTGFLDRVGDEIHTSMQAGAFLPKEEIKQQAAIKAYEKLNVFAGLCCGFAGHAQIGKGMWTKPDNMREMVDVKINHLQQGASCAWVPSPRAATLHAIHYHMVDVAYVQNEMAKYACGRDYLLDDLLTIPLLDRILSPTQIQHELDCNIQSILGYIVRWINDGVGCSKILDIDNISLMEDRATLRISSQHITNWLCHNICNEEQVLASLKKIAAIVDQQNINDIKYQPMGPDFTANNVFNAAVDLIFNGRSVLNGYTETVLHKYRREVKNRWNYII